MDPYALAGMVFSLVALALIGGVILAFPIMRRLGEALEVWIAGRREGGALEAEIHKTREAMGRLHQRLEAVEERQTFMEELMAERTPGALGPPPPDGSRRAGEANETHEPDAGAG